jgi:hypothetical protein
MVASEGMGMHALSRSMSRKTPGRPRSPTTLVAKVASESVMEARTRGSTAARKGSGRRLNGT